MNAPYPLAAVAELIGEPARAAILIALTDGRALPAGELARAAGVSAQSASAHLSKLVGGGLLCVQSEGRHRYYAMASPEVGHAVEALGAIATRPREPGVPHPLETRALYNLRSCYDHLAGRVAVELTSAFEKSRMIQLRGERDYELGPEAPTGFEGLGLDTAALRRSRRRFARRCLDWTERRPHIAGALGAAVFSRLIALGWVARLPHTRALRITQRGAGELERRFGILARA
ncbi:MAG TPA: helix-turn-helix transcriptional regulator [Vicinamibacteria bacterium]|jgi:DNA-binding transcriptional ArsR family regulator|nr:helix-turn-helix transcriptional regulator [Vicinamibacteria bacterium]